MFKPDYSNCIYYNKIINDKVFVLEIPKLSLKLYLNKASDVFNFNWLKLRCTLYIVKKG